MPVKKQMVNKMQATNSSQSASGVNNATQIPAWLETPPDIEAKPPVVSLAQDLPFGDLSWKNFEKLCLRDCLKSPVIG